MRRRSHPVDTPEFPDDVGWLNVAAPLRLHDLQGKIVLVNFWTSCCINCMNLIPRLSELAAKYAPELAVIGVHSPKCFAERELKQLHVALQRHQIDFPVIDDRDMRVWDAWKIEAWPTSILIDPRGRVIARQRGEDGLEAFEKSIRAQILEAGRSGGIDHTPIAFAHNQAPTHDHGLSFPGGILADEQSGRLFISDTNAHRIIATDFDGQVLEIAGAGRAGFEDGSFEEACFNRPQGAAIDGDALYVADRSNHAIRRVNFRERSVQTMAGTGRPPAGLVEPGNSTGVALQSPWDVEVVHHRIYITLAGAHQIWWMDLHSGELEPYAGSGAAGLLDQTRANALLAQPSGITCDGVRLFFTDAGASAIRWVYLPPGVELGTSVGKGIFEYGDRDGLGREALLQFPLGLEHHAGELYVADTYNNKIKRFNPRSARIETILGTGEAGFSDGDPPTFNEPRDVSCADGRLWIADTNNHAVRVAPLKGGPVSTLHLHPQERLMLNK